MARTRVLFTRIFTVIVLCGCLSIAPRQQVNSTRLNASAHDLSIPLTAAKYANFTELTETFSKATDPSNAELVHTEEDFLQAGVQRYKRSLVTSIGHSSHNHSGPSSAVTDTGALGTHSLMLPPLTNMESDRPVKSGDSNATEANTAAMTQALLVSSLSEGNNFDRQVNSEHSDKTEVNLVASEHGFSILPHDTNNTLDRSDISDETDTGINDLLYPGLLMLPPPHKSNRSDRSFDSGYDENSTDSMDQDSLTFPSFGNNNFGWPVSSGEYGRTEANPEVAEGGSFRSILPTNDSFGWPIRSGNSLELGLINTVTDIMSTKSPLRLTRENSNSLVHSPKSMYENIIRVQDLLYYMQYPSFSAREYIQYSCPCAERCISAPATKSLMLGPSLNTSSEPKCCVDCDCSDDCHASGMCCLQKTGGPNYFITGLPATRRNEVCIMPVAAQNTSQYTSLLVLDGYRSYLMVTSCDETYSGAAVMKCLHPDVSSISAVTPVYSEQTGLTYANKYCAECNFVNTDRVEPWTPSIICKNYMYTILLIEKFRSMDQILFNIYLVKECALHWVPKHLEHKTCLLNERKVHQCKEDLGENSKLLKSLCEQLMSPILIYERFYRNLFCYTCLLNATDFASPLFTFGGGIIPVSTAFNALLNTFEPQENPVERLEDGLTTGGECEPKFVYVPQLKTCLMTGCAPSMFYKDGACVPYFTSMYGVYLEVRITLSFHRSRYPFFLVDSQVLKLAEKLLDKPVKCSQVISSENTDDWAYYNVTFVVPNDVGKSFEESLNHFKNIVDSYVQLPQRDFGVKFTKAGFNEGVATSYVGYVTFSRHGIKCEQAVAMAEEQICPTVVLHANQYTLTPNNELLVQHYMFQQHEYFRTFGMSSRETMAHICKDKFFDKMGPVFNSQSSISHTDMGTVSLETVTIVCSAFALLSVSSF